MIIKVSTTNNEEINIILNRQETKEETGTISYVWEGKIGDLWLKIHEAGSGSVYEIKQDQTITTPQDEIIAQFNNQIASVIETESSGVEDEGTSEADINDPEPYPYDPELIRIEPKNFGVNFVNELIEEGELDLAPDFQRHFVWKELKKRSRLIESLMLRIPLPVFYLAQDEEGKYQVIDGLQRLTVINQFLNNKFQLKKLEYLKECEGHYFNKKGVKNNIDPKYRRRITQAQLTFNVIDPQTPIRVKYEIFKRINQGGKPLKSQEIRNCMASVRARNFLKKLAQSKEFLRATDYSISATRMQDQELVLRFIGFYFLRHLEQDSLKYTGHMDNFLNDTLTILNNKSESTYELLQKTFFDAMNNAAYLFGKYAFRKCSKKDLLSTARKQLINKSLFTTWSVLLSEHDPENIKNLNQSKCLKEPLASEIETNGRYYDALTTGTNDLSRINTSFDTAKNIINRYLKK
ncbi:MAG: DUF262 domain-containing protein [bacterium]|nr:DUF262 domain-containing protein [bacterium]